MEEVKKQEEPELTGKIVFVEEDKQKDEENVLKCVNGDGG